MKKIAVIALGTVLAASFASEAVAENSLFGKRKRRPGFFELLFGNRPERPRREVRQPAWWEDGNDGGLYGQDPSQKRKKKPKLAVAKSSPNRKVIPAVAIDPDVAEGLGMGNLDYVQPKLVAVFDKGFKSTAVPETDAAAIKLVLSDRLTELRATEPVQKAVLAHYAATGFKPLWTENGNISSRGLAVLDVLSKAAEEGLEPLRYKPTGLSSFEGAVAALDGDNLGLAQFDVALSIAVTNYALHQSGGVFEPERLSAYHDLAPQRVSPAVALRVMAYSPFPVEYLKSLAPKHPAYAVLKAELAKVSGNTPENEPKFAEGKRVRIGQKDERIAQLRDRLIKDGFISLVDGTVADEERIILDKDLARALKRFQEQAGVGQTSNLDAATIKALNGPAGPEQVEKLISALERLRWLPDELGKRHVFVNQASYRTQVMEDGKLIWASNVIVGRPTTQTAVFSDTFETVVFNPTWGVPDSILVNEYLGKLRANPGYADKIGFKVINKDGKPVSSKKINWNQIGTNSGITLMQPSGDGNALGEVKFLFPNKHSIYMHDTPNRKLFENAQRNLSHGCVRVQNPREFAQVLLGWDPADVDASIDGGEAKSVPVKKLTKVHLTYFTAWPDEDGIIRYYSDAYGRDAALKKARALMFKSSGGKPGAQVVQNQVEPAAKIIGEAAQ